MSKNQQEQSVRPLRLEFEIISNDGQFTARYKDEILQLIKVASPMSSSWAIRCSIPSNAPEIVSILSAAAQGDDVGLCSLFNLISKQTQSI